MSKSNDKLSKENRELRRQIEILRAQVKSEKMGQSEIQTPTERVESQSNKKVILGKTAQSKIAEVSLIDHTNFVKKDLLKSVVLSGIIFAIILSIFFSGVVS